MSVCTYDNPATWSRECWQDGKLLCSYSALLLLSKPLPGQQPIPGRYFFFGANIGPWKEGQHWGDLDAMTPQLLAGDQVPDRRPELPS